MTETAEVYGYQVFYTFRRPDDGTLETASFRSKGKSPAKARRAAIFKRGFVRVDSLEPFTEEQWLRCFGEGRL
jgi:hypothetical protein